MMMDFLFQPCRLGDGTSIATLFSLFAPNYATILCTSLVISPFDRASTLSRICAAAQGHIHNTHDDLLTRGRDDSEQ
jgi:hypothetical protein